MLLSISQHYFKRNDSAYYSNFRSISNYQAVISVDENDKFIKSRLIYDLDFVLKNRNFNFFLHVMDSYFPYYSELSFIDLILEIAELKTDFKPYIDYLDGEIFRDAIMKEIYDNQKPDLMSCLFLKKRIDIADYLIKEKNYPAIFIDKNYNFPYPAQAARHDHIENLKHIISNYNVKTKELARYLISPTKNFLKRIESINFFIESGFIEDTESFHKSFLFNNQNAQFTLKEVNLYCEYFNVDINTPGFKEAAESSLRNIYPFLHNKGTIKWLLSNNIDIKKMLKDNIIEAVSFIALQYDNKRFAFINYCKNNDIYFHTGWLGLIIQKIYKDYPNGIPTNRFNSIFNTLFINGLDINKYHSSSFSDIPEIEDLDWFLKNMQIQLNKNQLSKIIIADQKSIPKRI